MIERIDRTLAQSAGRFPMYADPGTGGWTWSEDGGRFGGFWPGLDYFLLEASLALDGALDTGTV